MSDRERNEFAARLVGDLQLRLTPRLIADARGEEPFDGRDFMPLQDAPDYYGVTERMLRTWLKRGVIAGFRFRVGAAEWQGRHIPPRVYWMVRAHEELRREDSGVDLSDAVRQVIQSYGWNIGRTFSPPVSARKLRAWARGRRIKDPRHRRHVVDLWNCAGDY